MFDTAIVSFFFLIQNLSWLRYTYCLWQFDLGEMYRFLLLGEVEEYNLAC